MLNPRVGLGFPGAVFKWFCRLPGYFSPVFCFVCLWRVFLFRLTAYYLFFFDI